MKGALAVFICAALGVASGEEKGAIEPRPVVATDSRLLSVPTFTFWLPAQCDNDGNMYFHVGQSGIETFKLSADGSGGKIFRLSPVYADPTETGYSDFSVTPHGKVYVLGGVSGVVKIFPFNRDGEMEEPFSPELPKWLVLSNLVATDAGTFLVFGFYGEPAASSLKGKGYMAVLDGRGSVLTELDASATGVDIGKLASGSVPSPGVALGEDGNFYFLGPKQIVVISPEGKLVQRIPFENPDPKSSADSIRVAGRLAVIGLQRLDDEKKGLIVSFLVVETVTGGVVGFYKLPKELESRPDVCFSPKEGLTFLQMEKGQVNLVTVRIP